MARMLVVVAVAIGLLGSVLASPSEFTLKEEDHSFAVPHGWKHFLDMSLVQQPIRLIVAVKQNNEAAVIELLHSVSNPASEAYGQYLSFEQLATLTAPHAQSVADIVSWIEGFGDLTLWCLRPVTLFRFQSSATTRRRPSRSHSSRSSTSRAHESSAHSVLTLCQRILHTLSTLLEDSSASPR
eukprot:Opistho-2@44548